MSAILKQAAATPPRASLAELEARDAFCARHIGPDAEDQATMLSLLGYPTRAALIDAVVPAVIREPAALALAPGLGETAALAELRKIAARNVVARSFIGQGYYDTHLPAVILRNILESPAWYTAYTPYQPEISQGRLEALINFQTMVSESAAWPLPMRPCSTRPRPQPKRWPCAGAAAKLKAMFSLSPIRCCRRPWTWCARAQSLWASS